MVYVIAIIVILAIVGWISDYLGDVGTFLLLASLVGLFFLGKWLLNIGKLIFFCRGLAVLALFVFIVRTLLELSRYYKYANARLKMQEILVSYAANGKFSHVKYTEEITSIFSPEKYDSIFLKIDGKNISEFADSYFLEKAEKAIQSIIVEIVKEAGAMKADEVIASVNYQPIADFFFGMSRSESITKCEKLLIKEKQFDQIPVDHDPLCKYLFVNPDGGKNLIRKEEIVLI